MDRRSHQHDRHLGRKGGQPLRQEVEGREAPGIVDDGLGRRVGRCRHGGAVRRLAADGVVPVPVPPRRSGEPDREPDSLHRLLQRGITRKAPQIGDRARIVEPEREGVRDRQGRILDAPGGVDPEHQSAGLAAVVAQEGVEHRQLLAGAGARHGQRREGEAVAARQGSRIDELDMGIAEYGRVEGRIARPAGVGSARRLIGDAAVRFAEDSGVERVEQRHRAQQAGVEG